MTLLAPTTFTVPTLETERLFLRAFRAEDFEAEASFWAGARSHILGGPISRIDAWRSLQSMAGHWTLRGYGFWALEEKATGAYVGRAGLWFPEGWPEREVGWTLMDGAEGKGYATEAALAARAHAYDELGWTTAISLIRPENARSAAVARRLGAEHERDHDHPTIGKVQIWRHPGPQGGQK